MFPVSLLINDAAVWRNMWNPLARRRIGIPSCRSAGYNTSLRKTSGSTGEPTFCTLWTLLGLPAVSVPLLQGANGLPIGVQLVGPRHGDGRLLRTARWLAEWGGILGRP